MANNLTLAQEPSSTCPYPVKHCGLRLCFEATDYINGAGANAHVTLELDPDNVPFLVGSTLVVFGTTFTVVPGTPTGPNQVAASTNPSTQWNNFKAALLSGLTVGLQPFTDYFTVVSSGLYITIQSIASGLNPPAPAGLFAGGVFVDSSNDGVTGSTKSGYHVVLDLFRKTGGSFTKVLGQNNHTFILPVQELAGGGNKVCFDVSSAFSVYPTPPPSDGSVWFLQENALALYYARYASFYKDDENPCGNVYSSYEQTETFKVINVVFELTDADGFSPYCFAASEEETLLLTDMPDDIVVCCDEKIWLSLYFNPDDFEGEVMLEYETIYEYSGGGEYTHTTELGGETVSEPSFFTFLANPLGCSPPLGPTQNAYVQIELDEAPWTVGSTFTVFGLTLTVVSGTPGTNELNPNGTPSQQMTNLYNALLSAEISPGVAFTSLYSVVSGFYLIITALSPGVNDPNPVGNFDGGIVVNEQSAGGGGVLTQITVTPRIVDGEPITAPKVIRFKDPKDCCCDTPLYFVGELGNIDFLEAGCAVSVDLEIDAVYSAKPASCADWINSGMWEVNNVSKEFYTCYITVKAQHEAYVRNFLKSVNKFFYDKDKEIYYRIVPAQKKYNIRKLDGVVYVEFSYHISYNLPNQIN